MECNDSGYLRGFQNEGGLWPILSELSGGPMPFASGDFIGLNADRLALSQVIGHDMVCYRLIAARNTDFLRRNPRPIVE